MTRDQQRLRDNELSRERYKKSRPVYEKICLFELCDEEFTTTDNRRVDCCPECGNQRRALAKKKRIGAIEIPSTATYDETRNAEQIQTNQDNQKWLSRPLIRPLPWWKSAWQRIQNCIMTMRISGKRSNY